MNRSRLTLTGLTLAGLLFAAEVRAYNVYGQPIAAAKVASGEETPPPVPEVEYTVADPAQDPAITTIRLGERTSIAAGERLYLADPDTFRMDVVGEGAHVFLAPRAVLLVEQSCGGPNVLTQIIGQNRESGSTGLVVIGPATIVNTITTGLYTGVRIDYRDFAHGFSPSFDRLYITDTEWGFAGAGLPNRVSLPDDVSMQPDIRNSVFWDNRFDLSFPKITGDHTSLRFTNCAFLSWLINGDGDRVYTAPAFNIAFNWQPSDKNKYKDKYKVEFVGCIFVLPPDQWTGNGNWTGSGFLSVREARPGRLDLVLIYPLDVSIASADFNADGGVDLEDFRFLAGSYGKPQGEIVFARILDLDKSGVAADDVDMLMFALEFADLSMNSSISELLASEQMPLLAEVLYREYRPVADALMSDSVFGPAITAWLERTAVVAIENAGPSEFSLGQNYPNPFNAETTIRFNLPADSHVLVAIYNSAGQEVVRIVDEMLPTGSYLVRWDGRDREGQLLASGVYLYRIAADGYAEMRKMSLLR